MLTFSSWHWLHLNISLLIFLNPIPLKVPELVMYACFGLIHLVHTESTQSQTLHQLSQHGMRLDDNWVNPEWDSMSTESMQNTPTFTKILSFRVDSVDMESHKTLTQLTWSLTWLWLSWRVMRLRVNWVTAECWKIPISRRIQEQNRKNSKALLFGLYVFDTCKKKINENKKFSCKCTFKNTEESSLF
jgi:hypothetical protein